MPAYRSPAEAEIREAVVAFLRQQRPNARIIHEINTSLGGTRIDVLAVDRAEIIAVEIKSSKDKLDRLRDQMQGMNGVAHHSIAVLHEKFLSEEYSTNSSAAHHERNGAYYMMGLPGDFRHMRGIWIYPQRSRSLLPNGRDGYARWPEISLALQEPLPAKALWMLWKDELLDLCRGLSIQAGKRPSCASLINALRWNATGRDLTLGICRALRSRECIEADPAIVEGWAA